MKRLVYILLLVVALLSLSGCETVRNFMARDLEDEDFIIGQLYADERVDEVPVIGQRVKVEPKAGECQNALGCQ